MIDFEIPEVKNLNRKGFLDFEVDPTLDLVAEINKLKKEKTAHLTTKNTDVKVNSKEISFDAYMEGKTIETIAQERGMATSTIEGHLAHYIGTGELAIEKVMPLEKVKKIIAVAETIDPPLFFFF